MRNITLPLALSAILMVSVASAVQNFEDDNYHEILIFNWDTPQLDVLVVPPASVAPAARLAAVEKSIDAWEGGIAALGAPWLRDGVEINRYTLGATQPPLSALLDPEIIVISSEFNPYVVFGIGAPSEYLTCQIIDLMLQDLTGIAPGARGAFQDAPLELHRHAGSSWAVAAGACWEASNNVCVVINTSFPLDARSPNLMYDLNAHEVGHCLGIGHVGDALDFTATTYPKKDVMSYQFFQQNVHCVSNLNVRAIEGVFAKLLGRPENEWLGFWDYVHMAPADYVQMPCENP